MISIKEETDHTVISLNLPEKRNALNREMIAALTAAFRAGHHGRYLLLQGEGTSFCAGADLNYMKEMKNFTPEENKQDGLKLAEMFEAALDQPLPLLCRVHGHVFGGALGLAAVSDVVLAEEGTQFCFSEVKLGLAPAVISAFTGLKMGFSASRRYFLTGEIFSAAKAQQSGLVHEVFSGESAGEELVSKFGRLLVAGAPLAQKKIREMTRNLFFSDHHNRNITLLSELIAELRVGSEGQEGISSFFEKRKPSWNS